MGRSGVRIGGVDPEEIGKTMMCPGLREPQAGTRGRWTSQENTGAQVGAKRKSDSDEESLLDFTSRSIRQREEN